MNILYHILLVRRVSRPRCVVDERRLWADEEDHILITAGGSAVFDLVLPLLRYHELLRPVRRAAFWLLHHARSVGLHALSEECGGTRRAGAPAATGAQCLGDGRVRTRAGARAAHLR